MVHDDASIMIQGLSVLQPSKIHRRVHGRDSDVLLRGLRLFRGLSYATQWIVPERRAQQSQLARLWMAVRLNICRALGLDFLRCVPPSIVVDDHGALHLVRANRWGSAA